MTIGIYNLQKETKAHKIYNHTHKDKKRKEPKDTSLRCNTSLHFTTLHSTTLHYTNRHFTPSHLHFTTLSFVLSHSHFLPL